MVAGQDALEQLGVADRAEVGVDAQVGKARDQFLANRVERVFGMVQQVQPGWPERDDLTAQFAADGAAGPGHEHGLAAYAAGKQIEAWRHRWPAEQVFEFQLADGVARTNAVVGQVDQPAQDFGRDAGARQALHDVAQALGGHVRNGDHDGTDAVGGHQLGQALGREHAQAGNGAVDEGAFVVEEAYRPVLVAVAHGLRQLRPGLAGAIDGDRIGRGTPAAVAAQEITYADTRSHHIRKSDKPVNRECTARKHCVIDCKRHDISAQDGNAERNSGRA